METIFYLCGGSSFISLGHIYGRAYIGYLLIGCIELVYGCIYMCVYTGISIYAFMCGEYGRSYMSYRQGGDVYLSMYL